MQALHKKSKQSLRPSTGRIGWDFFSKIDILSTKVYTKKVPNFEIVWPTPGMLRPLTVKGVYLVSHSLVCASFWVGVYIACSEDNYEISSRCLIWNFFLLHYVSRENLAANFYNFLLTSSQKKICAHVWIYFFLRIVSMY